MRRVALTIVFSLVLFVGVAAPAYAANLPLFDPNFSIVPEQCRACPCSYFGILQLIQNLINTGVSIGVVAFLIVITYAGLQFMLNPTNPETRSKARGMIMNVIVGMVIVLAAWLVVDFIMKILYDANTKSQGVEFGPWNRILSPADSESWCIEAREPTRIDGLLGSLSTGVLGGSAGGGSGGGSSSGGGTGNGQCTVPSGGPCSLTALQNSCYSTVASQAAQICTAESGGNPNRVSGDNNRTYGKTADGHAFAIGLFQINITNSFGLTVQGRNCSEAFSGPCQGRNMNQSTGRCSVTVVDMPLYRACVTAAQNPSNNIRAACMLNRNGGGGWGRWEARTVCGL